jgi:hypothetical protein
MSANVNNLSENAARAAAKQIVNNQGFAGANPHLTAAQIDAIQGGLDWPNDVPVFSPFAITHNGYSQVRYNGQKYLCHRVTYRECHGRIEANHDISHTVYVGSLTSR